VERKVSDRKVHSKNYYWGRHRKKQDKRMEIKTGKIISIALFSFLPWVI
jgi:hypothetical protein